MKIYGDLNSGNCLKVKWVSDALALPYRWIAIDMMKGETRTAEFLGKNPAGQVPVVEFDDGRTLAQSNAIIRYLAQGSRFIPTDPFLAAKMDEWLFWEQYSHEPYIGVARFEMVYLGKPATDLAPDLVKRGYAALQRMQLQLLAYTRMAGEGGFALERYPAVQRWIGEAEDQLAFGPT
jgi:glutathione S-transferase